MNVLFLTLCEYKTINENDIYTDLLREFIKHGDKVYMISPIERRHKENTHVIREENCTIVRLKIGNIQKTNILEKGISTVLIEPQYKRAISKYFSGIKFDLILYSTPPITLVSAVESVKKRDHALTYLLLKDIFPQNAVDMGMIQENSFLHQMFQKKEQELYRISDRIGCMSPANKAYVLEHNPEIDPESVEVCPNSIEILDKSVDKAGRNEIRQKYDIPLDKTVFIYGGNLGRPQGIPFIIRCLEACKDLDDAYFLVVGDGTEYDTLNSYAKEAAQENFRLMQRLPKEDYDTMVGACDVGLIFLDHRFTIPNFPSRIISYMQAKLPVLACTDPNTDIGTVITREGFGWWCESNNPDAFRKCATEALAEDLEEKKEKAWEALNRLYDVQDSWKTITQGINQGS